VGRDVKVAEEALVSCRTVRDEVALKASAKLQVRPA